MLHISPQLQVNFFQSLRSDLQAEPLPPFAVGENTGECTDEAEHSGFQVSVDQIERVLFFGVRQICKRRYDCSGHATSPTEEQSAKDDREVKQALKDVMPMQQIVRRKRLRQ